MEITPVKVDPIDDSPQPSPVTPIREQPAVNETFVAFDFYGVNCRTRVPKTANISLNGTSAQHIADAWQSLSAGVMDNTVRDCLEARLRLQLGDWAYLQLLDRLAKSYLGDSNEATMLLAWLYCQSGYQMRLGVNGNRLVMLYCSRHQIYNRPFFTIDGKAYYTMTDTPSSRLSICNATFPGEQPLSLKLTSEPRLGDRRTKTRTITSKHGVSTTASVNDNLLQFFDSYPTSTIGNNPVSRWAMYAETPLDETTCDELYPSLKAAISGLSPVRAAGVLLNWVQTGFVYEYDDKVWGHDRAFFAEESLYYPYCDCEDRSILFSRLVRDLLNLDVALVYYPGHLATAVAFDQEVTGTSMTVDGRRFTICDPTYIGAPVGAQMPNLDTSKVMAIILKR